MGKSIAKVRNKLSLSKLAGQKELLSTDLDLSQIAFITRKLPVMRFDEAVIDGNVIRTIEGASTVNITVNDRYGIIRRSGRLASVVDIKIDGLWFRLVKVQKTGDNVHLTFESREVAVLRTYNERRVIGWGKMRRARFAQILVQEVKEFKIPFICPDLQKKKTGKDKGAKAQERDPGFGFRTDLASKGDTGPVGGNIPAGGLTIKGKQANHTQLENCETVLDVGTSRLLKRKLQVCAIMTGMQESSCYNLPYGDGSSVGFFQEIALWGSIEKRMNLTGSAGRFFDKAARIDRGDPKLGYGELCQAVQRSAYPDRYDQHKAEAEKIVTAYGMTGDADGTVADANNQGQPTGMPPDINAFQFTRGRPKTGKGGRKVWDKEDSWTCLQRLADEVNWRCFEVSGKIYFTTETHLFRSAPRARISEESPGVDWIDFDYDIGKKNATVTVIGRVDRWQAPPGTIIEIFNNGPVNGRWLVSSIERPFFDPKATITLKKPRPRFSEPKKEDLTGLWDDQFGDPTKFVDTPGQDAVRYGSPANLVHPIPWGFDMTAGGVHETSGLAGFPAIDFMARAGTPVLAPEDGKVTKWSGNDPKLGAVSGAGGPLGWSMYIKGEVSGTEYYLTHLGTRYVKVGEPVAAAETLGTIADYHTYGRGDHVHMGVKGGSVSIEELRNAKRARPQVRPGADGGRR
jgi:murein DD-endopeptidase MepM/ murein hydrolase activator NlpD